MSRTYLCPRCGYDGFQMKEPERRPVWDYNLLPGCPVCQMNDGVTVWLQETSDPRGEPVGGSAEEPKP